MALSFWCARTLVRVCVAACALLLVPSAAQAAPPPNDDFANAAVLAGDDQYVVAYMGEATAQSNEQLYSSSYTRTVWYQWTPATTHVVKLGSHADRQPRSDPSGARIYTGSSLTNLTLLTSVHSHRSNYNFASADNGSLYVVEGGQTYMVQVSTYDYGDPTRYPYQSLALTRFDMFGDDFVDAGAGQYQYIYNSSVEANSRAYGFIDGATRQAGEPVHAGVAGGARTIWRRVTVRGDQTVTFSTAGSEFDTVLAVYSGTDVASLTEITSNDDVSGSDSSSSVTVAMNAGQVYHVAISDTGSGSGMAVLKASGAGGSVNDDYASRSTYTMGDWDWDFGWNSTSYPNPGTVEPGEPATIGGATDTFWWSVTPAYDGILAVSLEHWSDVGDCSSIDYNMEVFTGSSLATLTPVLTRLKGAPWTFEINATAGVEYTFRVSGITAAPACLESNVGMNYAMDRTLSDDFADALDITTSVEGGGFSTYSNQGSATVEVGEPTYADGTDHSVWYRYVPTSTRTVSFGAGGYGQTSIHVFSGTTLGSLVPVTNATSDPYLGSGWPETNVSFTAIAGNTYYLSVGSVGSMAYGDFFSSGAVPPNDDFVAAVDLGTGPASASGTAKYATREAGEPDHKVAGNPEDSVWYAWTPATTHRALVDLEGTSYTSALAVYTGASVESLSLVGRDDGSGSGTNRVEFVATAGITYYIAVSADYFTLNVDVSNANDKFNVAADLVGTTGRMASDNFGADRQPGEPTHAGNGAGGGSVWYDWTAPSTGTMTLDTSGSDLDTVVAVYTGVAVEDLVGVAANDDSALGGLHSRLTFAAVAGMTYRIAVEGKGGAYDDFVLRWRMPQSNDLQAAPTTLAAAGDSSAGDVKGSGTELGEPAQCVDGCDATVWYDWTPAYDGVAGVRISASGFDTVLAVYTGTPGSLVLVDTNDDYGGTTRSRLRFAVTNGTTYRIQVAAKSAVTNGTFTIQANVAPANDDFAGAVNVTGTSKIWTGHNFGATSEVGEPVHAAMAGGRSIWVKWTAPMTGTVTVDTQGSDLDTLVGVYTGASVSTLTTIASDDDAIAPLSRVSFAAASGTTYYIAVDGKAGDMGDVALRINVPLNDMLVQAMPIVDSGFTPVATSTVGTTWEIGEPNWSSNHVGSVWFEWTTTTSGSRSLQASSGSVVLEVFDDPTFATLRPIETMASSGGGKVRGWLAAGTYWVRATSTGHDFTLTSPPSPANDDLANAQVLAGAGPWAGDDTGAAGETFEVQLGYRVERTNYESPSTWFAWTAPSTGPVTFQIDGDRHLSVWKPGPEPELMDRLDNSGADPKIRSFAAVAGQTYLLRSGGSSSTGAFTLTLDPAPAHDDFVNAKNLTGTAARSVDNNYGTSCETGEPDHAGNACDGSVWYSWTPAASGSARFTTVGSPIATTVAVYTGATVATLTSVASAAGPHPGFANGAEVDAAVVGGTTYYIAVSARSGERGRVDVQVGMAVPGDDIASALVIAGDSGSISGSTVGATVEDSTIDRRYSGAGTEPDAYKLATVWVKWTPSYSGTARLAISTGFNSDVSFYSGDPATTWGGSVSSFSSQIANIPKSIAAPVNREVEAGTTYWFRIGDYCCTGSYWGTYSIEVNLTPNDDFVDALTYASTTSRLVDIAGVGSVEAGEPDHAGSGDTRTYWWNWTASSNDPVSFTTSDSDADTSIGVYTGASVGALTPVASDNDSIGDDSRVAFTPISGTTYRIAVGVSGSSPAIMVLRRDAPTNDQVTQPVDLAGASFTTTASLANGVLSAPERVVMGLDPSSYSPWSSSTYSSSVVWYRWTAPASAPTSIDFMNSGASIYVYDGANPATMTPVATTALAISGGTRTLFDAVAGHVYHVALGPSSSYSGGYTNSMVTNGLVAGEGEAALTFAQRPVNDDFADAVALAGWSASASIDTTLATREFGEPDHSEAGGASVWYSWTAPASGPAVVSTVGSDYDTLLGLYTGSSVTSLTPVGARDDYPVSTRAVITFDAVSGTTYRIAIDGYRGATGTAVVGVNVAPVNDDFVDAITIEGDVARTSSYSINATMEASEPDHAGAGTDSSVWWYWTPSTNMTATIDTFGSDFDTVLGVYTGLDVTSLALVASNDDSGAAQTSSVTFAAVAGTTYRIAVGGSAAVGNVRVRVNPMAPLPPDLVSPIAGATSATRTGPFRVRLHHEDIAVLAGGQVEVCADAVAPADPWSSTCASGYQVVTGPTLVSDGAVQDVSVGSMLVVGATYHWRARTIDDAGVASTWSAADSFVVGTYRTVTVSTLGHDDSARDLGGIGFGPVVPGTPVAIGPVGSGQVTAGAALEVDVESDHASQLFSRATTPDDGGGNTAPVGSLQWRDHDGTGELMVQSTWQPFGLVDAQVEEYASPGTASFAWDLLVDVPAATPVGSYQMTVTMTALAAP